MPAGALPGVALGFALQEQRRRLLAHDPGTRLGSDIEELHQMRVATRRLRAFLRAGRRLLDRDWVEGLRAELGWLGRELGPARDLDVLVERIGTDVASLGPDAAVGAGLVAELVAEQEAARRVVVEALSSARYVALLDRLDEVADPPLSGSETTLTEVWARQWKRTRGAVSALPPVPADDELHAVRIAIKRARYAAELAGHELGEEGRGLRRRGEGRAGRARRAPGRPRRRGAHRALGRRHARAPPSPRGGSCSSSGSGRVAMRAAWPGSWLALREAARKLT